LGDKPTKAQFTDSETLPITVVIDREGKVHEVVEGIMYQDEFDQKVKPLLSSTQTNSAGARRRVTITSFRRITIKVGAQAYRPSSAVGFRRNLPLFASSKKLVGARS
jgi:hypothetical protein